MIMIDTDNCSDRDYFIHIMGAKDYDTLKVISNYFSGVKPEGDWLESPPLSPMKWHFVQGSMESRHFESRVAPSLGSWATSFWEAWPRPCKIFLL